MDNIENSNSYKDHAFPQIKTRHIEPSVQDHGVTKARKDALQTLEVYRAFILILELTRMRKSRAGFAYVAGFWEWSFIRSSARPLVYLVSIARSGIDRIFRETVKELYSLLWQTQIAILAAETEAEIATLLNQFEVNAAVRTHRRRARAQALIRKLRSGILSASIWLCDQQFEDLKRAAFALDGNCDYHPGDPKLEAVDQFNSRRPEQPLNTMGSIAAGRTIFHTICSASDSNQEISRIIYFYRPLRNGDRIMGWVGTEQGYIPLVAHEPEGIPNDGI
ncbi:hypothetical protein VTN96DRAFT_5769 [Rasamsonia emersonii]